MFLAVLVVLGCFELVLVVFGCFGVYFLESHRSVFFRIPWRAAERPPRICDDFLQISNFQISSLRIFELHGSGSILEYQKKIWSTKKRFWSTKKSSQMRGGRSAALHGILKITLRWDSKRYTSKQPKTTKNS